MFEEDDDDGYSTLSNNNHLYHGVDEEVVAVIAREALPLTGIM